LRAAPDFALQDRNGKRVRLSDYAGKVIALDFWATWCSSCKLDINWLNELQRQNADRGFAVIGIAMDHEGWRAVEPFLTKVRVNYLVLLGNQHTSELYGGVDVLPMVFLIDRTGRIADVHTGIINRRAFEQSMERLLSARTGRRPGHAEELCYKFGGNEIPAGSQSHGKGE
jgi:cytochrome c biogenesis protein CcmG/thiol:disulfide interchange protein DsbE